MSISDFLYNKIQKDLENNNFQKWLEKDKLTKIIGEPIIAFHGSTTNFFEEIDFEKLNSDSYVGKGFYTSDSIEDVNLNYGVKNEIWDKYKDGNGGSDLTARVSNLSENLSLHYGSQEFIENHFKIDDLSDYIDLDNNSISLENASILGENDYSYLTLNDEGLIDWEDFIQAYSENYYIKNEGWIMPVYVKMENPLFYTNDEHKTKINILPQEIIDFTEDNKSDIDNFKNLNSEFIQILFDNDLVENNELSELDIIYHLESYFGTYTENNSEEIFNSITEYINDLDLENEEEIFNILKDLFIKYEFLEVNNDEMVFFNSVYLIESESEELDNESIKLYNNIKNNMITSNSEYNHEYLYKDIERAFQSFEELNMDNYDLSVYDLYKFLRTTEEPEVFNLFNYEISNMFDGIILDADEANNDWRMDGINHDTRHYILFNPNNVKFALYNNGDYSLENNNMAARKSYKQKIKFESYKEENIINDLKERLLKLNNHILPHIETVKSFSMEEDALLDKNNNKLIINMFHIKNKEHLNKVVTHELIGHHGLDLILKSKEKTKLLTKVANHYKKEDFKDIIKLYPELKYENPKDRLKMAEEKICYYAENKFTHDSFMNSVVNKIKFSFIKFKKAFKINNVEDDVFFTLYESNEKLKSKKNNYSNSLKLKLN